MQKRHALLAILATVGVSLAGTAIASNSLNRLGIGTLSAGGSFYKVNKDTPIVLESAHEGGQFTYVIPRGEGEDDDVRFRFKLSEWNLPHQFNYNDAFLFFPNMYEGDGFLIAIGFNNITHIRFDYYMSENRDDNTCGLKWEVFDGHGNVVGYEEYDVYPGASAFAWNRPSDMDPSIRPWLIEVQFHSFKGNPTFRIVEITASWTC